MAFDKNGRRASVIVLTSMSMGYYNKYGKKMIESFDKNWPEDIFLIVTTEDHDLAVELMNVWFYDKERPNRIVPVYLSPVEASPLFDFIERNRSRTHQDNDKELTFGAIRFAPKSFTIYEFGSNPRNINRFHYFIWLDADVVTHAPVTHEFLSQFLDPDSFASYLGRSDNYPECGFVVYNGQHPKTTDFFTEWKNLYLDDTLFNLAQWHDSYVFDHLRRKYEAEGVRFHDITPWGRGYDHVFINSPLGTVMDHMKGGRKDAGKSYARDFIHPGAEPDVEYWKN